MDRDVALVTGPNAPAAARERAAEFFSSIVGGEDAATLRLLVSEIVSEAVERAGAHRRVLQLHLACEGRRIHVTPAPTTPGCSRTAQPC